MGRLYKVLGLMFMSCCYHMNAQLLINEIQVTNVSTIADEDGEYEDWFEIYNAGADDINLSDYYVSDRAEASGNWQLPDAMLGQDQHVLVFASGKNRYGDAVIIDHLESPIFPWNAWRYLVPAVEPNASWNEVGFNDSAWELGVGGIGFGDGDDGTDLGGNVLSVYCRTTFNLTDFSEVGFMLLNVDYDDAFVCYLNGVEIARANIGTVGLPPAFNQPADAGHEAVGYTGVVPDNYIIDPVVFSSLLQNGENVLSIQVHNSDIGSSDLTGNVYLVLGITSSDVQTELSPDWINIDFPLNHADFGLSAGETLYLKNVSNEVIDSRLIDSMSSDNSMRRTDDGASTWCYTSEPTPGTDNVTPCFASYEPAPEFSIASGAYPVPVYLTLTHVNPDAIIYFTLDGSLPDETDELYTGPFAVMGSVVISARAYSNDALPSRVIKNTYLIGEDQIGLPIVSVSTDPSNLWDPVTGIHVFGPEDYDPNVPYFGANFWEDWEREAYVEYFDSSHVKRMEGPVGIKIHGGWSRSNVQKSLRLQAKGKFGMETMDFPMLDDKPFIESFKGINLRNGGNSYGEHRFHEALVERTNRNTNVDYMSYSPAIVFLNGEYWGFMEIRENLDQHFIANNHDISSNDVTVVSANYMGFNVISGTPDSFYELHEVATLNDPNSPGYYEQIAEMLDIENYADYIIAQTYWGNGDWSNGYQNNTKLWHDDRPGGKWRFMLMDMDFGMGLAGAATTDDYINQAGGDPFLTDQLFDAVIQNVQFRTYFINRYADLINTEYQIDNVTEMAYDMRDEVAPVFQRHATRWGAYADALTATLEQRLDWAELRVQGARDVVQNHFSLADQVDITLNVQPAGAGRIHISTIEPDEAEYPWTGVYFNGNPVNISVVENPGYTFSHWLANGVFNANNEQRDHVLMFDEDLTFTAVFEGQEVDQPIGITEMMFHPDSQNNSGDWLEIHNNTDVPVNMSHWYIKDANYFNVYEFPANTFLEANSYVVIASDVNAFQTSYPDVQNVFGPLNFAFGNEQDEVYLHKANGDVYLSYAYSNTDDIDLDCSSGVGHSREHNESASDYAVQSWFLGCENGSPGAAHSPCTYVVELSEFNYNSSVADDSGDWLELHNTSADAVDISGWRIRDENDNLYVVPSGTVLTSDEYLVVARNTTDFQSVYPVTQNFIGPSNLALGDNGDAIRIYDANNQLHLSMRYNSSAPWPYEPNGLGYTMEYFDVSNQPCFMINWSAGCPLGSPSIPYDPECAPLVDVRTIQEFNNISVYPNPANDMVFIDNRDHNIDVVRLFDLQSRLISEFNLGGQSIMQFDISHLTSGIYLVEVRKDEGEKELIRLAVK